MTFNSKILPPETQKIVPYLLLAAAVFLAYANIYDNAFLFDDNLMIELNEYLRSWSTFDRLILGSTTEGAHIAGGFYRPVQELLYFFAYQIAGKEPPLFHFINIFFHAANASLIYALGRKLSFNSWAVFLASLTWAVHPLHTEVIAYISGTAEPLFTFFCLSGLVILLPDFTQRKILLTIPVFLLGLLSKENAVVFPALVVLCLFFTNKKKLELKTYLGTWPLWVVGIVYMAWRLTASGFDGPSSYGKFYADHGFDNLKLYADHFSWRIYTFLATLPSYLSLLIWPTGLHMERSFTVFSGPNVVQVWEGIAIFLVGLGQIIWGRGKRGAPLSWGLLWFGAAHLPNTGLVLPMNSQFLEHWMYLPSIGLFLGLSQSLFVFVSNSRLQKAKPMLAGLSIFYAGVLSIMTVEQNTVWHDPFTFYGNIFKYNEPSARGHNNLALAYIDRGDPMAAISEFQKAIDITDSYAETRFNMALAMLQEGDPELHAEDAIKSLNRAIEIDPNFYRAWHTLAIIYYHLGDKTKARECYDKEQEILKKLGITPEPN